MKNVRWLDLFLMLIVVCGGGLGGVAWAQDEAPPVPPAAAVAAPTADSAETVALYDRAFQDFLLGEHDKAAAELDQVAARTVDPARRAAAMELARLARAMKASGHAAPQLSLAGTEEDTGRVEFVGASTLAAFYSSFALLDVFGIDDFQAGTLLVTGATAAGFLGSFFGTSNMEVSGGMATAYSGGMLIGLGNGLLLAPVLGIDPAGSVVDGVSTDGDVNQNYLLFGLGAMAAGAALGGYVGYRWHPTRAQATLPTTLAFSGLATVWGGMFILDAQPDSVDTVLTLSALGMDAGAATGILLAPHIDWSVSRTRYVSLAQFLGALGGFALGAIIVGVPDEESEGRVMTGTSLGGMWAGFGVGIYLTRHMVPDPRFATSLKQTSTQFQLMPVTLANKSYGLGLVGTF